MVAFPISSPVIQVMVYGIELTGDTPRFDFTDMETPSVIKNNPKKYAPSLIARFSFFIFALILLSLLLL